MGRYFLSFAVLLLVALVYFVLLRTFLPHGAQDVATADDFTVLSDAEMQPEDAGHSYAFSVVETYIDKRKANGISGILLTLASDAKLVVHAMFTHTYSGQEELKRYYKENPYVASEC